MDLLMNMQSAIAQGTLWGIMALGVYITFRLLDIADLSCEGSFAMGGCVSSVMIIMGFNPFITLIFATLAGMLAGFVTGLLHTKFMIPAILSGILTMIALYSVNIHIMGQPNTSLLGEDTVFTLVMNQFGLDQTVATLLVGGVICVVVILVLYWFFGTELGCTLRATGNNEFMVRALGGNTDTSKVIGLLLSNGLIALSGALVGQNQGYGDVKMGIGSIVIGLASIVIGEVIFGNRFNFVYVLISVVVGSVVYRMIISLVLHFGLNTDDMKLFTAIVVALALGIPALRSKYMQKRIPASEEDSSC
ncbi:MAG: ABC transporter permease [Anaerostipes sp.]|jgi:putative ABC transport system permease protein